MAWGKTVFLVYFTALVCLTGYLTCTLWLATPTETAQVPAKDIPQCATNSGPSPQLTLLSPSTVVLGENNSNIALFGCNLPKNATVKFNGQERVFHAVDERQFVVQLQLTDLANPGNILVTVEQASPKEQDSAAKNQPPADKALTSNVLILAVRSPADVKVAWQVFGREHPITLELRLILMVLMVGAFAACIAGMKSFADYSGENKLSSNWYWFYYAQPFVGAGLAFVFYLVMRGGLLTGTNADIKAVNPFGFSAIAALVGMFSDAAFRKLNEIFDTLFQAKDTRSEKLTDLGVASNATLPQAQSTQPYTFTFQAKGGKAPYTWSAVGTLPGWMALSAQGNITGTPPAQAPATSFTIQVKDAAGAVATQQATITVN